MEKIYQISVQKLKKKKLRIVACIGIANGEGGGEGKIKM